MQLGVLVLVLFCSLIVRQVDDVFGDMIMDQEQSLSEKVPWWRRWKTIPAI
jgi:hypothetical protein